MPYRCGSHVSLGATWRHFVLRASTFRCNDTGIGEAASARMMHAEQHAVADRFGSPN
jgi:hypothetical protein